MKIIGPYDKGDAVKIPTKIAPTFRDMDSDTVLALAALMGLRFRHSSSTSLWCWIVDEHDNTIYYHHNGKMITFADTSPAEVAREFLTAAAEGELGEQIRYASDFVDAARARVAGATSYKP